MNDLHIQIFRDIQFKLIKFIYKLINNIVSNNLFNNVNLTSRHLEIVIIETTINNTKMQVNCIHTTPGKRKEIQCKTTVITYNLYNAFIRTAYIIIP